MKTAFDRPVLVLSAAKPSETRPGVTVLPFAAA